MKALDSVLSLQTEKVWSHAFDGRRNQFFRQFITIILDDAGFIFCERSTTICRGGKKALTCTRELVYFFRKAHEKNILLS